MPPLCPVSNPGQISFLNRPREFDPSTVDWSSRQWPKLWRYNLHYFDYLHWPVYSAETKALLIDGWIVANRPGAEDAWEPYPISLRTVNWIKYFWTGAAPTRTWLESLGLQLAWLDRNLEYHLLANHLLKNAKALVFGGLFFSGRAADRLLSKGLEMMVEQGREQILPDGGHYERSAMYHAIALEDFLDVLNILSVNPGIARPGQVEALTATAVRAWQFFEETLAADRDIALFNDAAFGITPPAGQVLQYGRRVLGASLPESTAGDIVRIFRPDTGYFGYRAGGDSLLIDCGPGGPDYQPGHTHADTLSYELCLGGRRIVVDSGVFDYENTALRRYLRGTAAHNTVRVDGEDQSEVWGAFRVARRARPLYAELSPLEGGNLSFRGAHDGYRRLPGWVIHERRITVNLGRTWDITDYLTGTGEHGLESYIILHPDCSVGKVAEREFRVDVGSEPVARILVTCGAKIQLTRGWYCPEFGKKQETTVMVLCSKVALPAQLSYTIQRV